MLAESVVSQTVSMAGLAVDIHVVQISAQRWEIHLPRKHGDIKVVIDETGIEVYRQPPAQTVGEFRDTRYRRACQVEDFLPRWELL